jgi:hypothetical protein
MHLWALSASVPASDCCCSAFISVELAGSACRTYRGLWFGSAVAVKIINVWESKDGGSEDATAAGGAAEPVLEALLSRALAHPHIVSGPRGVELRCVRLLAAHLVS